MAISSGTLSADGNGDAVDVSTNGVLTVGGTFGSGTVTLQVRGDNGTWYSTSNTYTAADSVNLEFLRPATVRVNLSGATSPSLYWEIKA